MARPIDTLPAEARARHYRESATGAYRRAETAGNQGLKNAYLNVATGWHAMALEIELAQGADQRLEELVENPDPLQRR